MALAVKADLNLTIDGRRAQLSGAGRQLELTLESPATLRELLNISLPNVHSFSDKVRRFSGMPQLLKEVGLTLTIKDAVGPLLILGEGAAGKSYNLPVIGKLEDVALANKRAALRLAFKN